MWWLDQTRGKADGCRINPNEASLYCIGCSESISSLLFGVVLHNVRIGHIVSAFITIAGRIDSGV
jgi:hypothetical protein